MIDLSLEPLDVKTFTRNAVNQISFDDCYKIKYSPLGTHTNDLDLTTVIKQESNDLITATLSKEVGYSFVYIIRFDKEVKYVGRAIDIRLRLKNHFIKKNSRTSSKIKKVFKKLNKNKDIEFDLCILKIQGSEVYLMVEALLINHYETIKNGWNSKGS